MPQIFHTARASHYEYYPLVKGNIAPSFKLWLEDRISTDETIQFSADAQYVTFDELLAESQPLIIAFYTAGKQNKTALSFFQALQARLETKKNGRLLIITSSLQESVYQRNPASNNLTIFKDRKNAITKSFGLYDQQNPLWNWIPGIEESETFLPALYVVAPGKQIVCHHVDYNFCLFNERDLLHNNFMQRLLDAVENIADTPAYYPVSYKLVS